jgi:cyclohexanone monooxygenase
MSDPATPKSMRSPENLDAIVVGAGFAGLYMLHRLRGIGLKAIILEQAAGVGGTWYWNRYPGARCDVESMQYSFSFSEELQQEWQWRERFAGQPEILRYANHVADRFDLRRDIHFETPVRAAHFDDATGRWRITTAGGEEFNARYCIMATGCLSTARLPDIPGRESFAGKTYHTGHWPHEGVDFTGQTVGVIGTGSSAIQAIPVIAEQARQLFVFQRTANYSIPARNAPMTPDYEQAWKSAYAERRTKARMMRTGILYPLNDTSALAVDAATREREYQARWAAGGLGFMAAFNDLILDRRANDTAAEFVRAQIRAIVRDPKVAEILCPKDHPIGTKRICADTDYFATYNRDNVTLIDLRATPITAITPRGLDTTGARFALDSIVFATGFDAMTGTLTRIDIRGTLGARLRDKWEAGPRSYLGLMTAGFPNLFLITGPGSPSVLSNMMVSIEQHVDWIADCLAFLQRQGLSQIEPRSEAEEAWVAHGNEVADRTLYPAANSWYMGANIPGKPRVFMPYIGGVGVYREICDKVAAGGYTDGFLLGAGPARAAAE